MSCQAKRQKWAKNNTLNRYSTVKVSLMIFFITGNSNGMKLSIKKSPIFVQNNRIKIVGRSKLMDDFLYLTLNISYMKRNDSKNSPVFWEKSEWSIIKIQKGWVRHDPEIILSSCHIGDSSGYVAKHASFPKKTS